MHSSRFLLSKENRHGFMAFVGEEDKFHMEWDDARRFDSMCEITAWIKADIQEERKHFLPTTYNVYIIQDEIAMLVISIDICKGSKKNRKMLKILKELI